MNLSLVSLSINTGKNKKVICCNTFLMSRNEVTNLKTLACSQHHISGGNLLAPSGFHSDNEMPMHVHPEIDAFQIPVQLNTRMHQYLENNVGLLGSQAGGDQNRARIGKSALSLG